MSDTITLLDAEDNNNSHSTKAGNTKHLYEKAFYRGYTDFVHGRLDDPYRKYSLYSKEWQRGQNAAYKVNLRKLLDGTLIRNYARKKAAKKEALIRQKSKDKSLT